MESNDKKKELIVNNNNKSSSDNSGDSEDTLSSSNDEESKNKKVAEDKKEIKNEKINKKSRSRSKSSNRKKHHRRRSSSSSKRKHKHSRRSSSGRHRHHRHQHRHHRSRSSDRHKSSSHKSSKKSRHSKSPPKRDIKAESNDNFKRKMEEMLNTNGRSAELEMQRRVELAKDKGAECTSKEKLDEMRKKTEEVTGVKIPTFYNPNVVNPLIYAEQERKRKLLWSKTTTKEDATSTTIVGKAIVESQDEKNALKFRKLMGIKDEVLSTTAVATVSTDELNKMQNKTFDALDKEYQFARMATHTHRGMGLGFLSQAADILKQPQQPP